MTDKPTQPKPVKSVYRGMVADDDPIYHGGWNFIVGSYLAPPRTEEPQSEDEAPLAPHSPSDGVSAPE
jgi:hypothetical protein